MTEFPPAAPTILFRDQRQAEAAARAAASRAVPVWLRTAPGLAAAAGIPVVQAMLVAAMIVARREEGGDQPAAAAARPLIDCGERPGLALAAIRAGLAYILLDGNDEGTARAAEIARLVGGGRIPEPACRPLLDLAGCADPGPICRAWLDRWRQRLDRAT